MTDFAQKDVKEVQDIRKKIQDIRKKIEQAEEYFDNNKKRFNRDKEFVFKSTVTSEDRTSLNKSNYPILDINIIEPYLSKYCGNFYKQSPEVTVRSDNFETNQDQIDLIDGIMRAVFDGSNYRNIAPRIVKDQLCGFAVWEVNVRYKNNKSFEKIVEIKYANPSLCGFDPMSEGKAKEDARFYYKLYPMTKNEIQQNYPKIDIDQINMMPLNIGGSSGFSWKRTVSGKDIYYVCDFYEKTIKKELYYNIPDHSNLAADGRKMISISAEDYKKKYPVDSITNPEVVEERQMDIICLKRYKVIGDQLLESPEKLDGTHNRLIFVDGGSVDLDNQQYTRSYFYNVKDMQRIKNRCISNSMYEMMTLRKTKITIAEEALPESKEAINVYKDVDRASGALLYRAFKKDGTPLPGPNVLPHDQMNPQTMAMFDMADKTIQSQFGTYDAQLGIQQNQLSGKAIVEGAMQSSETSMPFIINYMYSLKQMAIVILDLIPVYYTTMRTIPYINKDGNKDYKIVNNPEEPGSIIDFDVNDLDIDIEAGPSFEVQRRESYNTLIAASQALPALGKILNEKGLPIVVGNMEIKDRQRLLQLVDDSIKASEEAAKNQPDMKAMQAQLIAAEEKRKDQMVEIKQHDLMLKANKQKQDFEVDVEKLRQSNEKLEEEMMGIKSSMMIRAQEAQNEKDRTDAELAIKQIDIIIAQEKHRNEMINQMVTNG